MTTGAPGRLMTGARRYDFRLWLRARGRPRAFLDEVTALARLTNGDSVLDVGCGTGTLALAAKRRVGREGVVHGIDPSVEFIARARAKAAAPRGPALVVSLSGRLAARAMQRAATQAA